MRAFLRIESEVYDDVMDHLLPHGGEQEQAVFLFANCDLTDSQIGFEAIGFRKLRPRDFVRQEGDYLEMADETRAALIKHAHDLGASLIEMHSHIGPWQAGFSFADRIGLRETVPHMWWRLKKRPYLALVVTESGFDALLWLDNSKVPRALDALLVGETILRPTNMSLKGWE